jgi:hypothetical protein
MNCFPLLDAVSEDCLVFQCGNLEQKVVVVVVVVVAGKISPKS